MLRQVLAIFAGYAIFVAAALLLFQLSGVDPHGDPSILFLLAVIACGIASSVTGGYVAQLIAKKNTLTVNFILALIIAGFAAFSFYKTSGNHYSQMAAIFLFAPLSIVGGYFLIKRKAN